MILRLLFPCKMVPCVLCLRVENRDVVRGIIFPIFINMMNDLSWHKLATEFFLRYDAMLMPPVPLDVWRLGPIAS